MNFISDKKTLQDMQTIISLYKKFDKYKNFSREDLYYHILPSIELKQYKIHYDGDNVIAFTNWAFLNKPTEQHYVETGEVLGKGTDDLESYELENKGYFRSGKVPVFDTDFFDMPEGSLEHNLLEKLRSDLDDSTRLDDKYEHKLLLEFKDRLDSSSENKGKVV